MSTWMFWVSGWMCCADTWMLCQVPFNATRNSPVCWCVQVRWGFSIAGLRQPCVRGTLCHSQCTVSEHVCLCSDHVKHCKATKLLQWAWSAVSHLWSPLQCVRDTLSSSENTSADKLLVKAKPSLSGWGLPHRRLNCATKTTPLMRKKLFRMALTNGGRLTVTIALGKS